MPDIEAQLEFLARSPLYEEEKPFLALLSPEKDKDIDNERRDNLQYERHTLIVTDVRGRQDEFRIDSCGFQVLSHSSKHLSFDTLDQIEAYKHESAELLTSALGAEHVVCYDLRLRNNIPFSRTRFDWNDPFLVEGPAKGAHNDCTFNSGPQIIMRYLPHDDQAKYLKAGYRICIVNLWRPLLPVVEDQPLALCDFRHLDPEDLVPADRLLPDRVGEVYYVQHSPNQQWCWLENQRADEPFIFKTYDTMNGIQAKYCPHVSFVNSRASPDAAPRRSVETRNIVIVKL